MVQLHVLIVYINVQVVLVLILLTVTLVKEETEKLLVLQNVTVKMDI